MELITFIVSILAFFFAYSAKNRVAFLEKNLKNSQMPQSADATSTISQKIVEPLGTVAKPIPQELISYIKKQTDAGVPRDHLLEALLHSGWEKSIAVAALEHEEAGSKVPTEMPIPKKPKGFSTEVKPGALIEWFKEDWLMKLGALIFIIGIGWFVTYAFLQEWIGERNRITLGLITGSFILALGTWWMGRHKNPGAVLVAVGAAIVTISAIAGRELYGFFTPVSELGIIFLVSLFAAFASVRYKSPSLAGLSIVLGHIAPIFVGGIPNVTFSFIYLFVIASATLWVAAFTGWRFLAGTSLGFFAWYSFTGGLPESIGILFIFATLYFATNVAAMVKSENSNSSDVLTAGGLAIMIVFWILDIVPEVWQSLTVAGWVVMFTVAAFIVFKLSTKREPLLIYSTIAIGLLGVATAMELSGSALTLAYTFEIAALVFATAFVTNNMQYAQQMSALLAVPLVLSLSSMASSSWNSGVLHKDFFVLLSLSAVLLAIGAFFWGKKNVQENAPTENGTSLSLILGASYALILLWLSFHALFSREVATTLALIIYTMLGMTAYITGKLHQRHTLFISGGVLLGAVVFRILFVEAWRLDMGGRIVLFLIIGALLLATAFIGRSRKEKNA